MSQQTAAPRTVLFFNHSGRVSGSEASLLRILAALDRSRYRPVVACPADSDLWRRVAATGTELVAIPPFNFSYTAGLKNGAELWRAVRGLWQVYTETRPAIVHANTTRAALVCAVLRVAQAGRGPTLLTHVRDDLGKGRANAVIKFVLGLCSTRVIGVSRYTTAQARIRQLFARKYATVFDGVDPAEFDPARVPDNGRGVRGTLGLAADAYPVIGVVGQLTPWKGQTEAIAAMREIVAAFPQAVMLIIGESKFRGAKTQFDTQAYERDLKTYVADHNLTTHVRFTGELADMPQVMAALDLLCLVSWSEPFGLVYIEAMAMARPVVATTVGGPADIVAPGVTGLTVPPRDPHAIADAITYLARAPEGMQAMGRRGRTRVLDLFTAARQARAIEAIYAGM